MVLILSSALLAFGNKDNLVEIPRVGGEYTEGLVGSPQHLNPLLGPANDVDMDLSRVVYSGLYQFDPDLNLVPDLASGLPEVSANGKEYLIKLKDNLFWHDGQPLTADDIVYTFQTIQNPDHSSPLRSSWGRVGVERIDERQIKLTTREASSSFVANLVVGIMPKHIWETVSAESFNLSKFNLEPVGSGPFKLTDIKRGRKGEVRQIKLEAYHAYHAGRPYLDNLTFKFYETTDELISAYQSRDVQGVGYIPFDRRLFLEEKDGLRQQQLLLPHYQAVFINRAKNPAPLEDARVRMALAKSVDKKRILEDVYGGQAQDAFGPVLPGHLGYHEQIPGADMNIYEPAKAEILLDQAGWTRESLPAGLRRDKQGRTLSLELATNNFSPNVRVAELLKEMWTSLGVQIVLNIETTSDLDEKFIRPRNYELLLFSENVGADPDPYPFWHSSQLRDPGLNLSTFSNKEADRILVEARAGLPAEERAKRYRKFQEIFVGDVPAIFIARSAYVYNLPSGIKGAELKAMVTPADRFAGIVNWHINTKRVKKTGD